MSEINFSRQFEIEADRYFSEEIVSFGGDDDFILIDEDPYIISDDDLDPFL